ncbi:H-NS histone family protein [Dyella sp. A6]|uniref:H-NS histone family protein n=1 Tax=Dyella aluminiiresistens TaxID=3069105 RepID=UPI002E760A56|nr:H-NS histone family protein [Dyella sp. A6]
MTIDLKNLSPKELQALIASANAQMEAAHAQHVSAVRAKVDALLKNADLTLDQVYPRRGGKSNKGPKAAAAPKYRNPENATQTWSGRGKRPAWFVAALRKKGVTADSLLITISAAKALPAKKAVKKVARRAPAKRAGTKK